MFDRSGRVIKDRVLIPAIRLIPKWIHPNAITVASLPFGLIAAAAAARGAWTGAIVLFAVNRVLDGLDGLVARQRGQQSDLGGYLDILVDFVVYAAVPVGVWWGASLPIGPEPTASVAATLALIALLAAFYVNAASWMYLSAILEKRGRSGPRQDTGKGSARKEDDTHSGPTAVAMPTGLIEGTETVIFFVLFLLFPRWQTYLFAAMAVGTMIGAVQRLVWAFRALGVPR